MRKESKLRLRWNQTWLTVLSTIVAFIPVELFIWILYSLGPITFIEKLLTLSLAFIIGGAFQVFLIILWICFLLVIWDN